MSSGYIPCACRDCFDVAVSDDVETPDLCLLCEAAGCDEDGKHDCLRDDAYGDEDEPTAAEVFGYLGGADDAPTSAKSFARFPVDDDDTPF